MGCWYATCALSSLPITYNEPALLLLLTTGRQQYDQGPPSANGTTYPDDLWRPIAWPFTGTYDDHGGIQNIQVTATKLLGLHFKQLKSRKSEDDHAFFDDLAAGKLNLDKGPGHRFYEGKLLHQANFHVHPLGHTFVRPEVWEAVLSLNVDNWHTQSSRALFREQADAWLDETLKWYAGITDLKSAFLANSERRMDHESDERRFFRNIAHRGVWFDMLVQDAILADFQREDILPAVYQVADLMHLDNVMRQLRLAWSPGTSRGSQEIDWKTHKAFHESMAGIAAARQKSDEDDA